MKKEIRDEIKKFWQGDLEDNEATLVKYSRDASLLEVRPKLVAFPKDSQDVQNLVKWVSDNKRKYPDLAITPRSAGTDMSGGAIGESIVLDFTRYMNKLIGGPLPMQDKNSWEVRVEPGMYYRDFEKITLAKGLILPCYTASKTLNAMGGMYANNSAGERTLKYGKTEDYVLEAKVVLSDGVERKIKPFPLRELGEQEKFYQILYDLIEESDVEITQAKPKVRKNSAGYYIWNVVHDGLFDLNKLLVGSQGTLGIVTEITFKLIPNYKYSKLVAIFLKDIEPLGRLVDEILELKPETLEAYDDKTMKLAVRFFPSFLRNKGLFGMFKFMWSFLPELGMMLSGGVPNLILLAEFAGENENEVNKKCAALVEKIKHFNLNVHITKNRTEAEKYWDIRRESFSLLRKHVRKMHTAPFIDDIIVRPEFLPKFLPELNQILGKYNLLYTLAGHAGDGNFHIIPLMDFRRKDTAKIILDLSERVYDLVARYHGSITAEHNDGLIRTPYLSKMYSDKIIDIFRQIKEIFDPKNIFNPGKKVPLQGVVGGPGTRAYIESHIAREHKASHKV